MSNGLCQKKTLFYTPPTEEIPAIWMGREDKIVSDNGNCNCNRTSEGGLTSNFLCGGGMDVFLNDPIFSLY